MKKARRKPAKDEMRAEYDFSKAVRGKYASRMGRTTTLVILEPDVAAVFGTSESVNSALRALVAIPVPKRRKKAS
jgi:hypothetical protein